MSGVLGSWLLKRKQASRRRQLDDWLSTALVVFHCTEEQASGIDVAVGPCVPRVGPRGGRMRPLASHFDQRPSETLDQLASLYAVITKRPALEAFEDRVKRGPGTLAKLSTAFTADLANIGYPPLERDHDPLQAVAESWFTAIKWPRRMQIGGVRTAVLQFAIAARLGREKGHPVYCWHGPAVPIYGLAMGVGQESYAAYRKAKRR